MRIQVVSASVALLVGALGSVCGQTTNDIFARDAKQAVDAAYTKKIAQYTTDPQFTSPLVSYLPLSKTVPTPEAVLGDVAGAPDMLPYSADVAKYFRLLAASTKRMQVVSIGKSEEGRLG